VASGNNEVYQYDECISVALNSPGAGVNQPDCVAHYALCKFRPIVVQYSTRKTPKYNKSSRNVKNAELMNCIVALYMTGNDWSAGAPQPY
jgi:hypothetical protein